MSFEDLFLVAWKLISIKLLSFELLYIFIVLILFTFPIIEKSYFFALLLIWFKNNKLNPISNNKYFIFNISSSFK